MFDTVIQAVISILSGLAVAIPLVIKLIEYVKANIKEKNWATLLSLVTSLMETAEMKYEDGAKKKEFVMAELKVLAGSINYEVDWKQVDVVIDQLCAMSKVVNAQSVVEPTEINA